MIFRRVLCAAALLAFAVGYHRAEAQEAPHVELLIMGKSFHVFNDTGYHFNDLNPGIGVEYRYPQGFFFGALTYKDSYSKQAYAAYVGYQLTAHVSSNWSVFAAARAGYINGSGFNGPGILPSVGVTYKRLSIEAEIIPKIRSNQSAAIGLFARWSFE